MKDHQNSNQPSQPPAPAAPDDAARIARRRRFLKAGATAVPAGLTLASRPVLAWHCNTTSAWGSAQMMPNQSTTDRNIAKQLEDETWTIADWKNNTQGGVGKYPWVELRTQTSTNGVTDNSKKTKISYLFGSGPFPVGLSANNKIWDKITNGTEQQKYLIVAKLNSRLIPNVNSCLSSNGVNQLTSMLGGTYVPPNAGARTWTWADIKKYLEQNWIVRAS